MSAQCTACDFERIKSDHFSVFDFVPEANRLTGESENNEESGNDVESVFFDNLSFFKLKI